MGAQGGEVQKGEAGMGAQGGEVQKGEADNIQLWSDEEEVEERKARRMEARSWSDEEEVEYIPPPPAGEAKQEGDEARIKRLEAEVLQCRLELANNDAVRLRLNQDLATYEETNNRLADSQRVQMVENSEQRLEIQNLRKQIATVRLARDEHLQALQETKKQLDKFKELRASAEGQVLQLRKQLDAMMGKAFDDFDDDQLGKLAADLKASEERLQQWNLARENVAENNSAFICYFKQTLMDHPVSIENGETFERERIEKWFEHLRNKNLQLRTPLKVPLTSDKLIPNTALKQAIRNALQHEWLSIQSQPSSAGPSKSQPSSAGSHLLPIESKYNKLLIDTGGHRGGKLYQRTCVRVCIHIIIHTSVCIHT
jgi:hypothetical protein